MSTTTPKGDLITGPPAEPPNPTKTLTITTPGLTSSISLVPLTTSHASELYLNLGSPQNDHLYTYLPDGPFHTPEALLKQINFLLESPIFFPYAIFSSDPRHLSNQPQNNTQNQPDKKNSTAIGIITLMNINTTHRTIEIGHVLFPSTLQRTTGATEASYLLMKYSFEELRFLRVEWKTNSFNEASRRAALRLGFLFEGVFRKHMVVKGRRRDTAWFSVVDDEVSMSGSGFVDFGLAFPIILNVY
jgi:RimJ/RimL family protein N-acetyltransferase